MTIRKFYEYEGLGGGIDPKSSVKSEMTKEHEIVSQKLKIAKLIWDFNPHGKVKKVVSILNEIDLLLKQQLSAERERLEGLIKNDPVSFFLVNIMRSLQNEKWPDLINSLNERCSLPTAERERYEELKAKYDALVMDNATLEYNASEAQKHLPDLIKQFVDQERERAAKLVDALQQLAWHLDTLKSYHLVESIKQTLNDYDTATKEPGSH